MRARVPFTICVILAALAAGCGGGSSSSQESSTSQSSQTAAWADNVCKAADTWRTSVTSAATNLKNGGVSQDALTQAATDVSSATSTLASDFKAAGSPGTASGAKAKQSLDTLANQLSASADAIKTAASSATNVASAAVAATTVSTTLTTLVQNMKSTVGGLADLDPTGELKTAIDDSDACKQLRSGS
jgi:hypothetical protein